MKMAALLVLSVMMLVGLSSCGGDDDDYFVIRIGTTANSRPHTYYRDGALTGFDIELIRLIAAELPDVRLEFEYGIVGDLQGSMRVGAIDMIVNNIAKTPVREADFLFSAYGYFYPATYLVVHGNDTRTSMYEMEGARMGALAYPNWFYRELRGFHNENNNFFGEIVTFDNYPELFLALDTGMIDGTLCDAQMVHSHAVAANLNIQWVGEIWYSTYSFFMFRSDERGEEIRAMIDPILGRFISEGRVSALSYEWFGEDMTRSGN